MSVKSLHAEDIALQKRTAAHYDAYPFEFLSPQDEAAIEQMQPAPFVAFVNSHAKPGMRVAEIGCGPGRATMYLALKTLSIVAVDISERSLELAAKRAPNAKFIQASNLNLPLQDDEFDMVISDGVIHHTPNARRSFSENARILKPGGTLYLGVYNRRGYYYFIYTVVGTAARCLDRTRLGHLLVMGLLFPPYYLVHLIKSRGRRSVRGAINFFYDYIMTPRASFHKKAEILDWARADGLELQAYDPRLGNIHVFVFRKTAP